MNDISPDLVEELRRLEESMWKSDTRFDSGAMDALLADDFLEFGCSGAVYDKSATLAVAPQDIDVMLPLPDFSVRSLGPGVVQLTYRSIQITPDGGRKCAMRSSIWRKTGRVWQLTFHQGTLLAKRVYGQRGARSNTK